MADKIFAGLDASAIETVPKFEPITKVTVTNGENSWSRGDDTGRELRVELPIAKSTNGGTFAQNILAKVSGLQYQPYNASGALIDPAAEIGDGVTIGGVYGGIYEQNSRFDQLHSSDIGAVADEELDNEYPYLSAQERDAIRQKRQTEANTTAIETNTDDISANSAGISANASAISGVSARVDSLSARVVNCEKIFTTAGYAGLISATAISCERINLGGTYTATWQSKTISGVTIYYLGRA